MPSDGVVASISDGQPPSVGRTKKKKEPDWDRYHWLLKNFALIYSTDTVWDEQEQLIMKLSAMAHHHGAEYVKMWKAAPSSFIREEGKRWVVRPDDVVFDPTGQADPLTTINLFNGLQIEEADPDHWPAIDLAVGPMLRLAEHLMSRVSVDEKERAEILHWMLCWLAYPLQHAGAKLRTAIVMHGDEGAGKNMFFEAMLGIYGQYGVLVGQDELEDKFNDWRSRKCFVVADEASSRQELVHSKNRLKALITSPTVQINPKGLPRREEANHMNVCFLSNEIQPLALDNSDRRYLVVFTPPKLEDDFYVKVKQWLDHKDGLALWYSFLRRYDLKGFKPFSHAPITDAKLDLIDINRKSPERFWLEWSNGELQLPYRSCSVDQAYRAYGRYATRIGERYAAQKEIFSRTIQRVSDTMGSPLRVKSMKVDDGTVRRSTRMVLVTEPHLAEGATEGKWATDTVAAFEPELRRYMHSPSHGPDDQGEQT